MFKHRDNIEHNPTTVDPSGGGFIDTTTPTLADFAAASAAPTAGAPTAARKRPRDVRGIDRFRQVIFGERGLPRFHGMVSRTPMLMYPPDGVDAARRRVVRRRELREKKAAEALADEEMWGLFEERRQAEAELAASAGTDEAGVDGATAEQCARDEALAQYHHKQLDALLKLFYEFNHTTFVKLPVNDTLQLVSRCGKEAVAHVMEYEMHSRLSRDGMLKELRDLRDEESQLQRRREALDAAEEARALQAAERVDDDMEAFLMQMAQEQMEAAVAEKDILDTLEGEVDQDEHADKASGEAEEAKDAQAEPPVPLVVVAHDDETAIDMETAEPASSSPPRRSVHFAEAPPELTPAQAESTSTEASTVVVAVAETVELEVHADADEVAREDADSA